VGLKVKHKLKPILLKCSSMINASLSYVWWPRVISMSDNHMSYVCLMS
jgi:hypothetical protein